MIKNVLSIAGVDPSGGAGVLADIKAMSALGTYAMGVVAALTAQNTRAVTGVMPVPASFVTEQLDTLFADVRVDAVKIGMLGSIDVMQAVAQAIERYRPAHVVLDTVMVAKSGNRLMPDDAVDFFRSRLLPLADMITPNLPEAGVLLKRELSTLEDMRRALTDLDALCKHKAVIYLKGGHLEKGESCDMIFNRGQVIELPFERVNTKNTHGTGCTLSSALAALWAQNDDVEQVVRQAKAYIAKTIAASDLLTVGSGHGPVNHFVELWER